MKVLIIDSHTDFRRLLTHHISIDWPDAVVSEYEPSKNGPLPDTFAGAGNTIVLLGHSIEPMSGLATLRRFCGVSSFPPVLYLAPTSASTEIEEAKKIGADAVLGKDGMTHASLVEAIKALMVSRRRLASTARLFIGDTPGSLAVRGYQLVRKISSGNFSSVYLTEHLKSGETIVLKVLRQVPDAVEESEAMLNRFLREYELIASLRHPNIVKISDFGVGDDHAFIAMEYFPDGDLRQRIRRGISPAEAVQALREIAAALAAMSSVGILHRDLKPGNIMCREDGSIALIDFGLAKQLRLAAEITGTGEIFGTPYYMSPEQGHGRTLDERGDIYSLGIIYYEMLTGKKPFVAETPMGIIYRHSHDPRPVLPDALAAHQDLLNRMIAVDPADRFQSVAELVAAIP